MDESKSTFDDTLQKFLAENRLKPGDRELLTHDAMEPQYPPGLGFEGRQVPPAMVEGIVQKAQSHREKAAMAIDLLAIRTAERQAESQDRHTQAMRWLTVMLVFTAILQAFLPTTELPRWLNAMMIAGIYAMFALVIVLFL